MKLVLFNDDELGMCHGPRGFNTLSALACCSYCSQDAARTSERGRR